MRRTILTSLLTVAVLTATAEENDKRQHTIWFDTPNDLQGRACWYSGHPERWTDKKPISAGHSGTSDYSWEGQSLPIGNGSIGGNVMGSIDVERITLNEKTLWRGGPNTSKGAAYYWNVNKQSAPVLYDIRQAFLDGDQQKAAKLTREHFNSEVEYEVTAENPFRFGNFTTMGELYIETGISPDDVRQYNRSLSLDSALATVSMTANGVRYTRNTFVSYPDNVMVMRFAADKKGCQNLKLTYGSNPVAEGTLQADDKDGLVYTARLDNNSMQFVIRLKAIAKGGTVSNANGALTVEAADEVTFLLTADTDYKMNFNPDFTDPKTYVGVDPSATTERWMKKAAGKSYNKLLATHYKDYSALFDRVSLELNPDIASPNLPTPQRLKNYRQGIADYALEELYFQYGRYLLIASSRPGNMPANLQGMWHNNVDGPWRVDYHNNINIQMNYWHALNTNLAECMQPFNDFVRTLKKPGEVTARSYFGARGWTASISANIFGFTTPLSSHDMSWNFNPMAGPWLATHLWEYYDFTRDLQWLRHTGYPLIKSSADFAFDYLWKKPNGTYTAAPSTSPEHGPIDEGATFVHAVVREILMDAIAASEILNIDEKKRAQWQEALNKLAPYRIGRYGQLMEWSKDIDDPKDEHRHLNHLFGLHPGRTISPLTTPELAQAAKVVLQHRGDGATGWSMGWKLNQWARLHDGNHAYVLFGNLLKNGTTDNLWDIHPPFQIDGNFGGTAGITEMLLQSHTGDIHLLPALPDAWKSGKVRGLKTKGNFELSINWQDGELTEAILTSHSGGTCTLIYRNSVLNLPTKQGKSYRIRLKNQQLSMC